MQFRSTCNVDQLILPEHLRMLREKGNMMQNGILLNHRFVRHCEPQKEGNKMQNNLVFFFACECMHIVVRNGGRRFHSKVVNNLNGVGSMKALVTR